MLTREQFLDYVDKNYNFHLMDYQKTALWEFYRAWMTNEGFSIIYNRGSGKMFTYKIMKELLAYEHQMKDG